MEQAFNEEEDSQEEFDDGRPKKVRKDLARIEIPFKGEAQPIIFSYHYKYEKFLRDNHLLDVSAYCFTIFNSPRNLDRSKRDSRGRSS